MSFAENLERALYKCRPAACTLFMTSACNFQCPRCSRAAVGVTPAKDMNLLVVKRVLEVYPEISNFTLAGFGEPTLCKEFWPVVHQLAENRKAVNVITNGTNPDPLVACRDVDLSLTISLYGYDRVSYLANTGMDVFPEVILNYQKLSGYFRNIGFSVVVGRDNWQNLEKYIELFDRIEPPFVVLVNHLAYDIGDPASVANVLHKEDANLVHEIWERCRQKIYIKKMPVLIDPSKPSLSCRSYAYLINVDGDGNIGGCQRQIGPDSRFGNILSEVDPFNSPEMMRFRKRCGRNLVHGECEFCFGNWAETGFLTALSRSKFGILGKLRNILR